MGAQTWGLETLTDSWWSEIFGVSVRAGEPTRIGDGLVGMNLRFSLDGDGVPESVVVKLASTDPTSRATGIALRNYEREVRFYREIASTVDVRAPHCHFADWNPETGDFVIVLEDMAPAEQGNQITGCTLDEARTAVTELARLHGPRWNDESLDEIDWLGRRESGDDASQLNGIFSAVKPGFLATFGESLREVAGDDGPAMVDELGAKIAGYVAAKTPPYTVTHGDYRLDNMLFSAGGASCAVVDWQTPNHGPGVVDVSYFLGAAVMPEVRRSIEGDLVEDYIAAIRAYGVELDRVIFLREYAHASFAGLVMAVVASMVVTPTERGEAMFAAMATRAAQPWHSSR